MEYSLTEIGLNVIWKDGQFLDGNLPSVFHDDSGFSGALGVFDSMLAMDGVLIDPAEHFERLLHDVDVVLGMGTSWMPDFVEMTNIWQPVLSENRLTKGPARIRTTVTGGISSGPLTVSKIPTIIVTAAVSGGAADIKPATCAIIRDFPRVVDCALENCKRLDYSRSFAARRMAVAAGADEAIVTNTEKNIACGATSNIFIREGNRLITPPLRDGVLAGVTRRKIVEGNTFLTKPVSEGGHGFIVAEENISEERLKAANEVFLTNSFVGLRLVTKIL